MHSSPMKGGEVKGRLPRPLINVFVASLAVALFVHSWVFLSTGCHNVARQLPGTAVDIPPGDSAALSSTSKSQHDVGLAVGTTARQDSGPAPAIVDWSQFWGPPSLDTAAILARDMQDPALPLLIKAIQTQGYRVTLLAVGEEGRKSGQAFLHSHPQKSVELVQVSVHGLMLNATMVKIFIHMYLGEQPLIVGRGACNLLLLPSNPQDHPRRHNDALAAKQQQPHTRISDEALATYDFMLYRTAQDLTLHMPIMMPIFERLQEQNRMFPVPDVLTIPTTTTETAFKAFNGKVFQVSHRSSLNKIHRFFMDQTLNAYKTRLTPTIQLARASRVPKTATTQRYAAVIVEARPHYAFLYTVLNAAWYLPSWDMHIVHSRMNAGFVRRMVDPYLAVTYHQLEAENVDIDAYNLLMKSASFWSMFNADYILLFQTDSLILRPGLEKFARFDYIGAPWHLENERWSLPELKKALPAGVGNGGFSLRSSKSMIDICNRYSKDSPVKEQEDVFFAMHVEAHEQYEVADRQSAYSFCLEVPCHDLPATQPYAMHAGHYYNDMPTVQRLLDSSLYYLATDTGN